jgi:hypothetical protein
VVPPDTPSRLLASLTAAALLSILILAAWLTPSPRGYGTHEQLRLRAAGLQTCTWVALTGKPCPTCGMTTAFAHAADGNLLAALRAQPLGAVLALTTATGFWVALHVAVTASAAADASFALLGRKAVWISLALLLGSWVYKIATWPGP